MLKEKRYEDKKPKLLFRIAAVIIGLGIWVHLTSRECAKSMEDMQIPVQIHEFAPNGLEDFEATAYCDTGVTKSGYMAGPGRVAADPNVIPLGSMIYIDSPLMGGIYQVLDTGGLVKGNIVDIFIPSYERCIKFGRRKVRVKVLRYGFLGYPPDQKADK
jgi:3D (Asp-Asp-Asp) domain-containing protein